VQDLVKKPKVEENQRDQEDEAANEAEDAAEVKDVESVKEVEANPEEPENPKDVDEQSDKGEPAVVQPQTEKAKAEDGLGGYTIFLPWTHYGMSDLEKLI
jgi:hypothetical protein